MRLIAKISNPSDDINWLVIEKDKHGTKGYFLFYHANLGEPCLYDNWFESIDYAYEAAELNYGIAKNDWTTEEF